MFLDKTSNRVKGYIRINVCGFFVERFFNLALNHQIKLWDIQKNDADATISANIYDYKRLVEIAKKTGCKIKIVQKVGMPFYLLKHKNRGIFVACFLAVVGVIYFYSLHIWKIDITGNFSFPIEEVKQEIEKENIRIGVLKSNLDLSKIKNNIQMRRHDIAWIGIRFKGTNATIEIVEANLKKVDELDKVPCDIIACKDGIIYKLDVLTGNPLVEIEHTVRSGDILVSGALPNQDGTVRYVSAKGEVYAKTWYMDKLKVPYEVDIISNTGKEEKTYTLWLKNYSINLSKTSTKFEKYDKIITEDNLNLFGKWEVPLKVVTTTFREIEVDTIKYTKEQAIANGKAEVWKKMQDQIKDVDKVGEPKFETVEYEDGIVVTLTVECIEKIGIRRRMEGYETWQKFN